MKGRGGEGERGGASVGSVGGLRFFCKTKRRRGGQRTNGRVHKEERRREKKREEEEKKKRRREKKKKKNKNDSLDCVPSPQRRDINLYVFRRCGRDHAGAFCLNGSGQIAHSTSS